VTPEEFKEMRQILWQFVPIENYGEALAELEEIARRAVSGQEAEWYEVTTDGEREVVSADHYHRHDWPRSTARPLFAAPIPATEQKEPK
jgi:hypothetical protein